MANRDLSCGDDLESEAAVGLDGAAILIHAVIDIVRDELLQEEFVIMQSTSIPLRLATMAFRVVCAPGVVTISWLS